MGTFNLGTGCGCCTGDCCTCCCGTTTFTVVMSGVTAGTDPGTGDPCTCSGYDRTWTLTFGSCPDADVWSETYPSGIAPCDGSSGFYCFGDCNGTLQLSCGDTTPTFVQINVYIGADQIATYTGTFGGGTPWNCCGANTLTLCCDTAGCPPCIACVFPGSITVTGNCGAGMGMVAMMTPVNVTPEPAVTPPVDTVPTKDCGCGEKKPQQVSERLNNWGKVYRQPF